MLNPSALPVVAGLALFAGLSTLPAQSASGLSPMFADLPGAHIRYIDTGGKGVPIVLLHAATGSADVWENQIKPFTGAGYRVIAFDRRGWAQSVTTAGAAPGTAARSE